MLSAVSRLRNNTSSLIFTRRTITPLLQATTVSRTHATMAAPVTPAQVEIVKATAPVLKEHGTTITTLMYNNLLAANPDLRNVFNMTSQANGRQPEALARSVLAYATHIDNLPALSHAVERIAQKHVSLFLSPSQYDIVGEHLMAAIGEVLGPAATADIVDAWTAAYAALAGVFIQREKQMYEENGAEWKDWRGFRIAKKVRESENIMSVYLEPVDGGKLPPYLPGQYISLQVKPPGLEYLQSRQYSLSIAPRTQGDYYRISVKREDTVDGSASPPGLVSNMIHSTLQEGDEVKMSHPQGEFFVDPADQSKDGAPLVLMAAGVGATPMMSILESVVGGSRPVSWIQAARAESTIPFVEQVKAVVEASTSREVTVKASVFLEAGPVGPGPYKGFATGYEGRIVLEKLDAEKDLFIGNERTEYGICGPAEWMLAMRRGLVDMGVAKERIALELFDTGDVADD